MRFIHTDEEVRELIRLDKERVLKRQRAYWKKYYKEHYSSTSPINRMKKNARSLVYSALKRGRLSRGICWCGESKVQAHHQDYTKPLDVIWLCIRHHADITFSKTK